MGSYELTVQGEFAAAHRLRMHDGRYEPLHGHTWRVEVFYEGSQLDAIDVVADFTPLRRHLEAAVGELHERCLNDLPAFAGCNPSAGQVARHLFDRLGATAPGGVRLTKVRVWEGTGCAAAYCGG